ncbi:hypothetical protein AB3X91_39800 [Paraburkholderia sp. BR14263]|uniref:hypothetical protein n=1 Tax=unclassified Paraburkholderia TaxID=2615204 RepID=UPI0034CE7D95
MDVGQEHYVVDHSDEVVETSGLGPCIGVAIIYQSQVSLIHTAGADEVPTFGDFCEAVDQVIPQEERSSINPIVAGGDDSELPEDAVRKREYVLAELQDMGFGLPQVIWCPRQHAQTILVDCIRKTATLECWNPVTDAYLPSVQLKF